MYMALYYIRARWIIQTGTISKFTPFFWSQDTPEQESNSLTCIRYMKILTALFSLFWLVIFIGCDQVSANIWYVICKYWLVMTGQTSGTVSILFSMGTIAQAFTTRTPENTVAKLVFWKCDSTVHLPQATRGTRLPEGRWKVSMVEAWTRLKFHWVFVETCLQRLPRSRLPSCKLLLFYKGPF